MDERDADMERFDQLLERSSLGTTGARRLRRRTPALQVAAVRRIAQLRNRIVHSLDEHDIAAVATELVDYLIELGYHGQADHVLHEWFPRDGGVIADLAMRSIRRDARSAQQAAPRQCPRDETTTRQAGIATLTLAPASDHMASADPRWHDELHPLFTELHEQIGAVPVRCRRLADSPPETAEPIVLVLAFQHTANTVDTLSACLLHWLNREPGRRLDIAVDSSAWSQRLILCSDGTWSLMAPASDDGKSGAGENGAGRARRTP